jgi:LysM repeat protein
MRSRTRHSSSRPWRPRRTAAAATQAGVAAVALVALMVAPPVLLLRFVGNPVAGFEHFSLTSPLTDVEVKGILALVIWLAWAQLVACVVSETAAQIRGFTIPASVRLPTRVPLTLGIQQRLARQLVVAVLAFVTVTPSLAAAAAAAGSPPGATASLGPVAAASYRSGPIAAPVSGSVVVVPGQSLSAIAATQLGSADSWPAIWELNRGSAQPGGRHFTDPDLIRPGWTLRLPANSGPGNRDSTTPATRSFVEVAVRRGDTLWSLAQTHLGSGERWPQIWALTKGMSQPDGRQSLEPSKIRVGWIVRVPADGPGASAVIGGSNAGGSNAGPPALIPPATNSESVPQAGPGPTAVPDPTAAGTSGPDVLDPPTPSAGGGVTHGAAGSPARQHDASDAAVQLQRTGLGLTAIAAAAVVGAVGRRRLLQQRSRRIGRRIAMPGVDDEAAELELRLTEDSEIVRLLNLSVRTLMLNCEQSAQTFPQVGVVRLFHRGAELLLTEPALPIEPFIAAGPTMWRFDAATAAHLLADEETLDAHDVAFPFPLLVTIGLDERGPVMVNLEAAGALTVVGEPAHTQPVLNAAATELATSELSAMATVQLLDIAGELVAAVEPNRAASHDNMASALRQPARFHADTAQALQAAGHATMHEARTQGAADLTFPCQVLVSARPLTAADRDQIMASGIATPGFGTGVVVTAPTVDAALPGWLLRPVARLQLQLEPFGLTVHPQQLVADDLADVARLLTVSGDRRDVAPADMAWAAAAAIDYVSARKRPLPPSTLDLRDHTSITLTAAIGRAAVTAGDTDIETRPIVRILGAVSVTGARGDAPVEKRAKATEIAAYLALHPNASRDQVTEAIWPDKRIATNYRQQVVSVLRGWLGTADDGEPYLGLYVLHGDVRFDWAEFEIRAKNGFAAGVDGLPELEAALALVRDRPFAGARSGTYAWADALIQQDIMPAIRDVADAVATIRLAGGDPAGARAAAAVGLLVEPNSEVLLRHALRAAHARRDHRDVADIIARVDKIHDELDDNDPETVELLAIVQLART